MRSTDRKSDHLVEDGTDVSPRAFVFFDLGETLVELQDLVTDLGAILRIEYPSLGSDSDRTSQLWINESAEALAQAEGPRFATAHAIASGVLTSLLRSRGVSVSTERAGMLLRRAWDRFEDHVRLPPDVTKEWLSEIRGLAAGVGLVTDADAENVDRLLDRLGIRRYFDAVTMSESVRSYKPSARVYETGLEALRAKPERSLFVSDAPRDLVGAAAVGMATAHIQRHLLSDSVRLPPGSLVLASLRELGGILERYSAVGRFERP